MRQNSLEMDIKKMQNDMAMLLRKIGDLTKVITNITRINHIPIENTNQEDTSNSSTNLLNIFHDVGPCERFGSVDISLRNNAIKPN